jgi:hypothetical protein
MDYQSNADHRQAVIAELGVAHVAEDVATRLIDEGGIGTVTIRTLGADLIGRLLQHADADRLIAIVLALTQDQIRRLDEFSATERFADFIALAPEVLGALVEIHAGIDLAGLIEIGTANPGRVLADLVELANGAQELTAAEVVQLARIHAGIDAQELIEIGQASHAAGDGARPLNDLVALANAVPALISWWLIAMARQPFGGALGETFIQNVTTNALTAAGLADAAHAADTAQRQAVLNSDALRTVIRANLGDEAFTVMSALLEGSQQWLNPPNNDFFNHFVNQQNDVPLPNAASMNCWESILYAAYLAGLINARWIRDFYYDETNHRPTTAQQNWAALGFHDALPRFGPRVQPQAGQLLFYVRQGRQFPAHVSLSLGGIPTMSLWTQPNNTLSMQRIPIGELHQAGGRILIADPPW